MREKLLNWLIHMAMHRRRIVLLVSVVLTIGLGAASGLLQIDTRWSAMLPQSIPAVKEFNKIDENFLQPGNMIVVVSGPNPVVLERITDEAEKILADSLVCPPDATVEEIKESKRYARHVYGAAPEEWLTEHALQLAKPKDVERVGRMLGDTRLLPYLVHLNDDFEAEFSESENIKNQERQIVASLDAVEGLVDAMGDASKGVFSQQSLDRTLRDLTVGRPYSFSLDNTTSLLMVAPALPSDEFEEMVSMDRVIERLLAPLAEKYPDYRVERTGLIPIGRDEMDSVGPETTLITLLALFLIFLLLSWNFRSALAPLVTLLPIVAGIVWTMGIIGLTLGSLNLLTSMIMVILLGLGIDFCIHLANRFQEETGRGKSIEDALKLVLGGTGKGVMTGAGTTAAAFLVLMVAEQKAIFELGLTAGIGVLVTVAAAFWILPAMLVWRAERWTGRGLVPKEARNFASLGSLAGLMGRWRWGVIGVTALLTALGILAAFDLQWEYNFLNLEPANLRSVELQDELIEKFKISPTAAMVTVGSIEESRRLRGELKSKSMVGDVDDISQWVSRPDFEENRPHIHELREALSAELPALRFTEGSEAPSGSTRNVAGDQYADATLADRRAMLAEETDRLWANLVEIQALSFTAGQDRVVEKTRRLVATRERRTEGKLRQLADRLETPESVDWEGMELFSDAFAAGLRPLATRMAERSEPVTLEMLPEKIRALYTSRTRDGFLMQVMPNSNLFDREQLERFRATTDRVSQHVTGTPHLILEMNDTTLQQGGRAMIAALAVVLLLLLVDFRRPLLTLLAILPLGVGLALTLAAMWLLGEKLNYLNMIALPVIIGIGVDNGVHFFHRFLQEGRGGMKRAIVSVGHAMMMSSLTTMVGFGSLLLYSMRGMQSMGLVLLLGVGMCFVVTVTLLPALTTVFEDRILKEKVPRRKEQEA